MTFNEFENMYALKECCCFTGHRSPISTTDEVKERVRAEAENLINNSGVKVFLCGGALGFDTVAALEILRLKSAYPFIKLVLILPCKNQSAKWTKTERAQYDDILNRADLAYFLSEDYYDGCMLARNDYMVEHSNYCICFLRNLIGGTYYTVSRAKRLNRELIML